MSAHVRWIELDALMTALRALPDNARAGADPIVRRNAQGAYDAIKAAYAAAYKRDTGDLVNDLRIGPGKGSGAGASVTVLVYHLQEYANWLEFGTAARHTRFDGANRGVIQRRPLFYPIARRYQQAMADELADMVEALGAIVRRGRG